MFAKNFKSPPEGGYRNRFNKNKENKDISENKDIPKKPFFRPKGKYKLIPKR